MWALAKDVEFANAIGVPCSGSATATPSMPEAEEKSSQETTRIVSITGPAGMTLTNNPTGGGCLVTRLKTHNGARRAGIKTGEVVLAVNGSRVNEHAMAIHMIDARTRLGTPSRATNHPDTFTLARLLLFTVWCVPLSR